MKFYDAPAKLNLFLHIVGRRADGYHELQTVFRLVDRCDRVGIEPRSDGEVRFSGPFGEDNLCVRAARLLKRHAGAHVGCDLVLEKHIPIGGGMGGGSSDAATTLCVLNREWKLRLPPAALATLALQLGADVPFFLLGTNAVGEGVGERLQSIDLPAAWYLVLEPQVAVPTREIFSDASLTRSTKRLKIPPFLSGQGANDLEEVVCRRYPDVAAHLAWLRQRSAGARMTGSGACVFAEFSTEDEALALHSELPRTMRGFVARGLQHHPLFAPAAEQRPGEAWQ